MNIIILFTGCIVNFCHPIEYYVFKKLRVTYVEWHFSWFIENLQMPLLKDIRGEWIHNGYFFITDTLSTKRRRA